MTATLEQRLEFLESRFRELSDREAIRDVLHRYCRAADRVDLELMQSCYWPDATDCHGFFNGNGREFCKAALSLLAKIKGSRHAITNTLIDFDGDRAFVDSQCEAFHVIPVDESKFIFQQAHCHYVDVFEKREQVWKIRHRTLTFDHMYEDVRAYWPSFDGLPQPTAGKRAPDDLSYKGFGLIDVPIVPIPLQDLWGDTFKRHAETLDKLAAAGRSPNAPVSLV